jgi:hypothetical protein
MLDLFHIDTPAPADVQIFNAAGTWQTWRKPRGCSMGHILALSAGSGGGGGFTRASGSAGGGGGGGGSGAQLTMFIPLWVLPDTMNVFVALGGAGGVAGAGGATGSTTTIELGSIISASNDCLVRIGGSATAGGGGSSTAGGSAGAAAGAPLISNYNFGGLAEITGLVGQAGLAGGAVSGASVSNLSLPSTGLFITGGCGGAGTTSTANVLGGGFSAIAGTLLSEAVQTKSAGDGGAGSVIQKPFYCFGGMGGAANNSAVGGNGGDGAYGCGGGGGGAGTTGGKGGKGGDGLVVITCW